MHACIQHAPSISRNESLESRRIKEGSRVQADSNEARKRKDTHNLARNMRQIEKKSLKNTHDTMINAHSHLESLFCDEVFETDPFLISNFSAMYVRTWMHGQTCLAYLSSVSQPASQLS